MYLIDRDRPVHVVIDVVVVVTVSEIMSAFAAAARLRQEAGARHTGAAAAVAVLWTTGASRRLEAAAQQRPNHARVGTTATAFSVRGRGLPALWPAPADLSESVV